MLLAAVTSDKDVDNSVFDLGSLPTFSVANKGRFTSRLTRMPKVVCPLSSRFAEEQICLKYDLVVELKVDKRYVHINQKGDSVAPVCLLNYSSNESLSKANESAKPTYLKFVEKSKSILMLLSEMKVNSLQFERMTGALSGEGDADILKDTNANFAKLHPLVENTERHVVRVQKKKRSDLEETWKLLDNALYQNVKGKNRSPKEKCSDKALAISVAESKTEVTTPSEVLDKDSHPTDPRLLQSREPRNDSQAELDLPLPQFASAHVSKSATRQNWPAAKSFDILPDTQTQSSIDVIIGVRKEAEEVADDQPEGARICLMESVKRHFCLLDVLTDSEFSNIAHELKAFQQKIAAAVSKHHSSYAD